MADRFTELCRLASSEKWCWNLYCTTCGNLHFHQAFRALVTGQNPAAPSWPIHRERRRYRDLDNPQEPLSPEQMAELLRVCGKADLQEIRATCRFPDWLGYLGIVLFHAGSARDEYVRLSRNWSAQLAAMIRHPETRNRLLELAESDREQLYLGELGRCESDLMQR